MSEYALIDTRTGRVMSLHDTESDVLDALREKWKTGISDDAMEIVPVSDLKYVPEVSREG